MKNMLIENIKPILLGILSLFAVLVGSFSGGYVTSVPADSVVGAISGPEHFNYLNVHGTFTYGDGTAIATSTKVSTYTFVEKDLAPYSLIDLMENTGAASFTLPATSTMMQLLKGTGASRQWLIHNATSTSGISLTLVAGAGMDLIAVTANDDVIDPGEYTRLTCSQIPYRDADNENIVCIVDELANAD